MLVRHQCLLRKMLVKHPVVDALTRSSNLTLVATLESTLLESVCFTLTISHKLLTRLQLHVEMEKFAGATSEKVRNHVPVDLAFSILSKLPLKSLKRFGCVHKSWTLLFETPHFMNIFRNNFISKHHSYYDDTSLLLHQTVDRPYSYLSVYSLFDERFENMVKLDWPNPFQEEDPVFHILDSGSITGTLCLYQWGGRVVLWNPATEEFKVVPPSPDESVPPCQYTYISLHGFGYDHVRDDYKLIRYITFFDAIDYHCHVPSEDISYDPLWEIYSLKSNSWRKLEVDVPTCYRNNVAGERLYKDGMCYWWGWGGSTTHKDDASFYLTSFDLSNELFFTTPIDIDDSLNFDLKFHLVLLNGSIALISWYYGTTTFHISVLGELGVKESWTKLFTVGPLPCMEHPIGTGKNGDVFFKKEDGELVCFDLSTQMIQELGIKGEYTSHIVIYKESLLPIEGRSH